MRTMRALQKYLDLCRELKTEPTEHESRVLSVGSEFLPAFARRVRDGKKAGAAYWLWLAEQMENSEAGR